MLCNCHVTLKTQFNLHFGGKQKSIELPIFMITHVSDVRELLCAVETTDHYMLHLFIFLGETVESLKQHKEDLNTGKKSASQVDDVKDSGDEEKENTKDKENEPRDEQDLVFVQDVGFTVKINAPGVEQFDIQVSIISSIFLFIP